MVVLQSWYVARRIGCYMTVLVVLCCKLNKYCAYLAIAAMLVFK
jgi:hypothetical protein